MTGVQLRPTPPAARWCSQPELLWPKPCVDPCGSLQGQCRILSFHLFLCRHFCKPRHGTKVCVSVPTQPGGILASSGMGQVRFLAASVTAQSVQTSGFGSWAMKHWLGEAAPSPASRKDIFGKRIKHNTRR